MALKNVNCKHEWTREADGTMRLMCTRREDEACCCVWWTCFTRYVTSLLQLCEVGRESNVCAWRTVCCLGSRRRPWAVRCLTLTADFP